MPEKTESACTGQRKPIEGCELVEYLSPSVSWQRFHSIVPKAFVGPSNRLLVMFTVGKNNGSKCNWGEQTEQHFEIL